MRALVNVIDWKCYPAGKEISINTKNPPDVPSEINKSLIIASVIEQPQQPCVVELKDPHTAKFKPWRIKTAIAFTNRQKALDFERYLKTKSGRAFAKKRF